MSAFFSVRTPGVADGFLVKYKNSPNGRLSTNDPTIDSLPESVFAYERVLPPPSKAKASLILSSPIFLRICTIWSWSTPVFLDAWPSTVKMLCVPSFNSRKMVRPVFSLGSFFQALFPP